MMMSFVMKIAQIKKKTRKDQGLELLEAFGLIKKEIQKNTTVN